jgi:hypothetical protein
VVLNEAFPDLYGIAHVKDALVAVHLEFYGGFNQWNMSFARAAHDWEVYVFFSFFRVLYSVRVRRVNEDSCGGSPPKEGCLRLDPSIVLWFVVKVAAFLGRVFGLSKAPLRTAIGNGSAIPHLARGRGGTTF